MVTAPAIATKSPRIAIEIETTRIITKRASTEKYYEKTRLLCSTSMVKV